MSVFDVLRRYALVKNPSAQIPASVLLIESPQCIAIFDAYPKAKYHFLVLPRHPFITSSMTQERNASSNTSGCSLRSLDDLESLMTQTSNVVRREIVDAMRSMAGEVVEMIKDEMMKTEGFIWGIDIGFHAQPSMRHIHLHIISSDRISPALKTKNHYNSFRTDLGFFVHLSDVERWVEEDTVPTLPMEDILKRSLDCIDCGKTFPNMPALKAHLGEEWEMKKRKAVKG